MIGIRVFIASIILMSCNENIKEYYPDGSLKKKFALQDKELEGLYEEFYENGNIKETHVFSKGKKIDTSKYYFREVKGKIRKLEYHYNEDNLHVIEYFDNGVVKQRGSSLKDGFKIGKWSYFDDQGKLNKVLQFINLNGKEYVNQGWHFDETGDTISGKGNYMEFRMSNDTIKVLEPLKILVFLKQPLLSYESETFVGIPKGEFENLQSDFSNLNQIELDTLPSISNEGIVKNYKDYNHYVSFGLEFNKPGWKNIRGFLAETKKILPKEQVSDSFDMKERKIYFNERIYVTDTD